MEKLFINDKTSYDDIEEFLKQFKDKIESSVENKIIIETGEYGMLLFNRIVNNKLKDSFDFAISSVSFKNIIRSKIPPEPISSQFVEYKVNNNLSVRLEHNEELDKFVKFEIDGLTGFPIRSSILYVKEIK